MLVLTLRPGEVIVVPHSELTLTVIQIEGKKVQLGLSAPQERDVDREEVWRQLLETGDRTGAPRASATNNESDAFFESFAAELTSVAYTVMIRQGVCGSGQWLDLELELWKALTEAIGRIRPPYVNRGATPSLGAVGNMV
jgi:carbon storage regulator CsrA